MVTLTLPAGYELASLPKPAVVDLPEQGGRYRVKALAQIADLNAALGASLPDETADTVGGLVIAQLGRLPKRGETLAEQLLRDYHGRWNGSVDPVFREYAF